MVLEAESFTTALAVNGGQALEYIRGSGKGLSAVLLDISLRGDLDGLEVCRRLRSDPDTASLPVIFCTASRRPDICRSALEAGGQGFLAKPFSYEQLLTEIRRVLSLAAATTPE
ncbi:MAG: response regulator [Pseudomonadota bacterium]